MRPDIARAARRIGEVNAPIGAAGFIIGAEEGVAEEEEDAENQMRKQPCS